MSFDSLGLAAPLLSALKQAGFTDPTSVQSTSIPKALDGHDLMVSAQTGSGKTAAFMLPALNKIIANPTKERGVSVLVLAPTRELAMQVGEATKTYASHCKDLRVAVIVGGMPYGAQLKALSRRVDVLVATPGRLMDHIQAKRVKLNTVHTLVLDEADRMLDMGFIEDIESIVARTPSDRQTLLFSATLDGTVAKLASQMMSNPQSIEVSGHQQKHENITQALLYADNNHHKQQLLDHLLRDENLSQAIIFTATKRGADELSDRLCEEGFAAGALHGDMNQRQRTRTLGLLQRGRLRILVATDVAARGIDVQGITHAINYDLPMQAEDYTHRIGRTGRAGKDGLAFTLASVAERHKVRRIEHFIGQPIPVETIPGLEPTKAVRPTYKSRKGGGGSGAGARRRPSFGSSSGAPRAGGEGRPFRDSRPARPGGDDTRPTRSADSGDFRGDTSKPRRDRSSAGKPNSRPTGGRPGSFAGKKSSAPRSGGNRPAR